MMCHGEEHIQLPHRWLASQSEPGSFLPARIISDHCSLLSAPHARRINHEPFTLVVCALRGPPSV
jgi:hypothetical protein